MEHAHELFRHIYVDNRSAVTLVLFHGTGGSEHDFLFLNEALNRSYNLLSLRGNVDERGYARFFKRFAEGMFDQENICHETDKLHRFMSAWYVKTQTLPNQYIYLGYSNGANMILAYLFAYPTDVHNAVLLRPMLPRVPQQELNLSQSIIRIHNGQGDPLVTESQKQDLAETLESRGAQVNQYVYPTGHGLSDEEMKEVCEYLLSPPLT